MTAACWASLVSVGGEGFREAARGIMGGARRIARLVGKIDGLKLMAEPDAMIVCFGSDESSAAGKELDIYHVSDEMHQRGWILNNLINPPCLHWCVMTANLNSEDAFVDDLAASVTAVVAANAGGNRKKGGSSAIYGMAGTMPNGPINVILRSYNDAVLKV